MRILIVTGDFPNPQQPTRGTFNFQLARALARKHEVVVIAPVSWRDEWRLRARRTELERARTLHGLEVHHPRYYYPPGMLRTAYGWFLWRSVASTAGNVLAAFQPDVVMGYWLHPDGEVALRIAKLAGVPGVVMSGGSDVLLLARDSARRKCMTRVLQGADAAVFVSEHLGRAAAQLGLEDTPIHIVRRGVDLDLFCPGDQASSRRRLGLDAKQLVLLWVGRMVRVKGLDVLIDACARLQRGALDFALYLAGDGPLRQELDKRAATMGVAGRVVFAGVVQHGDLPDWYRAANVTVLPSRSEGVPNVLLESIACGTPFVASDVGGIAEIADTLRDRLVPAENAAALAQALSEVAGGRTTTRRRFTPVSWEQSAASLEEVFREVIEERKRPR